MQRCVGLSVLRFPTLLLLVFGLLPLLAAGDDPQTLTGKAILAHPAGQAIVAAGKLIYEGKLAQVRQTSTQDVREEWAQLSKQEQASESERLQGRAPDPKTFEADIIASGILTFYGESASLRIPDGEDGTKAMAFVSLEDGKWKVTGGPMTFEPEPKETAPPIEGAAILDHELGKLSLEYAKRLSTNVESAISLLSPKAQANRASYSESERKESDAYRQKHFPDPKTFAESIKTGGSLSFYGEKAYLNIITNSQTQNADGSTTFTSQTTGIGFERVAGKWMIAD
ncbi:MAG: hypothetical protein KDC71_13605 [Acidobacteria bacterium]|nr:hypothetical protein [Acidobacteriota bacterium]